MNDPPQQKCLGEEESRGLPSQQEPEAQEAQEERVAQEEQVAQRTWRDLNVHRPFEELEGRAQEKRGESGVQ
jgi:hypothetical protein